MNIEVDVKKDYLNQASLAGRWLQENRVALAVAGAGVAGSAWAYARHIEPHWLEVSHPSINVSEVPGLAPSWQGYKIAFLSDLHLSRKGPLSRVLLAAQEQVLQERPNLITLGGDYFSYGNWNPAMSELLRPLAASGIPIVAVMGNHDYFGRRNDYLRIQKALEQEGVRVLVNEAYCFEYKGQRAWLAGIDDYIKGEPDIGEIQRQLPKGEPALIMLSHNPAQLKKLPARFAHIILSGHTHGGQINFALPPFHRHLNWIKLVRNKHHSPYPLGWYNYNGMRLYVGRGLGTSGWPLRFNARPELVMLEFE